MEISLPGMELNTCSKKLIDLCPMAVTLSATSKSFLESQMKQATIVPNLIGAGGIIL
jgi:hypothetical protein